MRPIATDLFGRNAVIDGFREVDLDEFIRLHPDISESALSGLYTQDDLDTVKKFLKERGYIK
jgi:hypothetical protein